MPELGFYPISDLRIRVDLQDRFLRAGEKDAAIAVDVAGSEVSLDGVVLCDADAREAFETAVGVDGVRCVHSRLRVRRPPELRTIDGGR